MNTQETRPIVFSAYFEHDMLKFVDDEEGSFHKWADDVFYDDGDYHPRTIAIVERLDGNVVKVPLERVRFLSYKEASDRQTNRIVEHFKDI